ncbi:MAG: signal peptidase I [Methanomicrobiales archaeon]|nr:signal peptidase I [Methanomicrobiales archaeon]
MDLKFEDLVLVGLIVCISVYGIQGVVSTSVTVYPAAGTSMEPIIEEGDHVVVVPAGIRDISVGDIIVYRSPVPLHDGYFPLVVHRIVDVQGGVIHTKGDNRTAMDPFDIPFDRVKGKVMFVVPRERA